MTLLEIIACFAACAILIVLWCIVGLGVVIFLKDDNNKESTYTKGEHLVKAFFWPVLVVKYFVIGCFTIVKHIFKSKRYNVERTMTIKEMKETIKDLPDDMPITMHYNGSLYNNDIKTSVRRMWHKGQLTDVFVVG